MEDRPSWIRAKLDGGPFTPQARDCIYPPRFDQRDGVQGAERPFGTQLYRSSWGAAIPHFTVVSFSEMKARPENRVELDPLSKGAFGIPKLRIQFTHNDAERRAALRYKPAYHRMMQNSLHP